MQAAAKNLLVDGRARAGDIMPVYRGSNACLYDAVCCLGLPPAYTADIGDGPFNAARYNDNVRQHPHSAGIENRNLSSPTWRGYAQLGGFTYAERPRLLLHPKRFDIARRPCPGRSRNFGIRRSGDNGRLARNIDIYGDGRIPYSHQNLSAVSIPAGGHHAL